MSVSSADAYHLDALHQSETATPSDKNVGWLSLQTPPDYGTLPPEHWWGVRSMLCYDTDSHTIVKVPGLKAKDAKDFGVAVGAIRGHDKGNGEICVPISAKKILKFRVTLDIYPEQEKHVR